MTKTKKRKRTWIYIAGGIVLLLIAFRLYLPTLVLNYINKTLQELEDYKGHADDVDIDLYRGAYRIDGLTLEKTTGKVPVPFLKTKTIDISVEWKALFQGAVVAQIAIVKPELNFVKGPSEAETQTGPDSSWVDIVDKWIPLKLNKLEITEGEVHYRDFHSSPKIDILMHKINATATNLTNTSKSDTLLPSGVEASATAYGGSFNLKMNLNALAKVPTFDLNAELKDMNLTEVNDFLKAYANVDVKKGTFGLYIEAAAKDNRYEGYVKPILKDLDILQLDKEEGNALQVAWEAVAAGVAGVFKNPKKDQSATKIPFSGNFKETRVNIWATVGNLLKNAFISALKPSIDNSVNINQVEPGKPKSKKEERRERREQRKEEKKAQDNK